ncbi:SAM-dependent methyltransferase, partial [Streptomyces sp. SID8455]|nr:SAM-dependent methyltransferase [Streptomyces sp. SID8455]
AYVEADMRDTETVLAGASETLDLARPVALVINDVLGHIVDWDDALSLVRRLVERLPSGSYLALSHSTASDDAHRAVQDAYNSSG